MKGLTSPGTGTQTAVLGGAFVTGLLLLVLPDLLAFRHTLAGGREVTGLEILGTVLDGLIFTAVFTLLWRDILRRRRAEHSLRKINQELVRANEFKTEMLTIAAHDLKNPLGSLRMMGQILQMAPGDSVAVMDIAHLIESVSGEMISLVHNLIETSAIEGLRIHLRPVPVDLKAVLTKVIAVAGGLAEKKQQRIVLLCEEAPPVLLDEERLRQILQNLIGNAIKFSPLGAATTVSLELAERTILLTVRDEGPGLAAEELSLLFGRFQRLSARPTADESSNGLGLWIVREIVQCQQGRVWATSDGPGRGTTFHVELPLVEAPPQAADSHPLLKE